MRTLENQQSVEYNPNEKRILYAEDWNELINYVLALPTSFNEPHFIETEELTYSTAKENLFGVYCVNDFYVYVLDLNSTTTIYDRLDVINNRRLRKIQMQQLYHCPIVKIEENPNLDEIQMDFMQETSEFYIKQNPKLTQLKFDNCSAVNIYEIENLDVLTSLQLRYQNYMETISLIYLPFIETVGSVELLEIKNLNIISLAMLYSISYPELYCAERIFINSNDALLTLDLTLLNQCQNIIITANQTLENIYIGTALQCSNFNAQNCNLTEASVNNILLSLDAGGVQNGTCDLSGGTNHAPTGDAIFAMAKLINNKGWTITTN